MVSGGRPRLGCRHPFARTVWGMERYDRGGRVGLLRSATGRVRACSRRGLSLLKGADVPIAEAVVDQGEQLTGGHHGGDVAATALGQPDPVGHHPVGVAGEFLHRLDSGPAPSPAW